MKNINDFLASLAQGSTHMIANPKTIDALQKQGAHFDTVKKSGTELLDDLFAQRRKEANNVIKLFPTAPKAAIPTVGFLYDEIREAMLFGLNGAAISLSAILVEFCLKYAIVKKRKGDTYDKAEWDRVEGMELGSTIVEAKRLGILSEEIEKKLKNFKDTVRNPYLHYNIKKITKGVGASKVKKFDIVTQKVDEVVFLAEDNPIIWGFAKTFVDKKLVFGVFSFADMIVKYLFEQNLLAE